MRADAMQSVELETRHRRPGRARQHQIDDPYLRTRKPPGRTICPECGVFHTDGHWTWFEYPADGAVTVCPACRRVHDGVAAGIVTLRGSFVAAHRCELLDLIERQDALEKEDHPLHRIMSLREAQCGIIVETTDIHLPARIGRACQSTYKGELEIRYDPDSYFVRAAWKRDI